MKPRNTKTVRNNRRLRKRWYFNASANLPVVGRTSVSFGNEKVKRSLIPMVKAIAKKTIRNTEEAKHYLGSAALSVMNNDTIYTLPIHANIQQGDTDNSRDGDRIRFETLKLNLSFESNQDAGTKFRVMLIKTRLQPGATYSFSSGPIGQTDIFYLQPYKLANAIPDPKKCTVLFDNIYTLPANQITGVYKQKYEHLKIPLNTAFTYQTDSASYGKFHNYALVVIPMQDGVGGVPPLVNHAVTVVQDLIFKEV